MTAVSVPVSIPSAYCVYGGLFAQAAAYKAATTYEEIFTATEIDFTSFRGPRECYFP